MQDMFVDFDLAQQTAGSIKGIRQVRLRQLLVGCFEAGAVAGGEHAGGLGGSGAPPAPQNQPKKQPKTNHPPSQYITNEHLHCGIREAGGQILEKLLNLVRGGTLLR